VRISKVSRPRKTWWRRLRTFQKHKRPEFCKATETHQDLSPDRQTWAGQSAIQQITVIYAHLKGVDNRDNSVRWWCIIRDQFNDINTSQWQISTA